MVAGFVRRVGVVAGGVAVLVACGNLAGVADEGVVAPPADGGAGRPISDAARPDSSAASDDASDGQSTTPASPNPSYAYPTANSDGGLVVAAPFRLSIQSERPATIFYTLDGGDPTDASASASSPTLISIASSSTVAYRTDDDPTVHKLGIAINTSLQQDLGVFISEVAFDNGGGPVVIAKPGEVVTGKATIRRWTCSSWCQSDGTTPVSIGDTNALRTCCNGTKGYCPSCVRAYAYGLQVTEGCYLTNPAFVDVATYPGLAYVTDFSVRAPTTPGSYPLRRSEEFDFQCDVDGGGLGGDDARIIVR